jgi:hypothetical protein
MEETQNNSTTVQNSDLAPKEPQYSRDLVQSTSGLIDAGIYGVCHMLGLPPIIIPVIISGRRFITSAVSDPYVQHKTNQIGSKIGSSARGVYSWTKNTASSAKEKTSQGIYTSYQFTKQKTSQGISATARLLPEWKGVFPISIGLPNLGNLYRRSAPTTPPKEETR